ncbi:enoyl-CoA hydratase/isomerase family protein [Cytobacillus sp. FJAT-54145]|uniref:Ethylmalonyl-CoA decarboxylase n=1 Tax=Cytobacillus spartinae TaxID=3299023 RepID=A0ABW6KHM3_9BACI
MKPYTIEEHENGLLIFTITRESKRNSINYEVMDGLVEAIELAKLPHVKILIITGEGEKAFCSGGDLSVFHELKTEEQAYTMLSRMSKILYELLMLPKPTVALMNGMALGGGCELATACDFRIARKDIKVGFVQGKLAITTGWGGGTILLEKLPSSTALEILMESSIYTAEELQNLGFIHYIYEGDPLYAMLTFIKNKQMIEGSVLRAYKEIAVRKWNQSNIRERIETEVRKCSILWESEAHHKQVDLFINRK